MSTEPLDSTTGNGRAGTGTRQVRHETDVAAGAATVYRILADVSRWPLYFPPTVLAARISGDEAVEDVQIWAMANDELRTWVSRRELNPDTNTIRFRQTRPGRPVAAMSGGWTVTDRPGGGSHVVLDHTYRATGDDPGMLQQIERAVDANSRSELAHLRRAAERMDDEGELFMDFSDTVEVTGSLDRAYEFIRAADEWPRRLPHVARLELTETVPGLQRVTMDTRSPDGSVHRTISGRVCEPGRSISYKQTVLPPALAAHIGEWSFATTDRGTVTLTSRHQVILDPEGIARLPQPPGSGSLADVRTAVRGALGTNSRATMNAMRTFVEQR